MLQKTFIHQNALNFLLVLVLIKKVRLEIKFFNQNFVAHPESSRKRYIFGIELKQFRSFFIKMIQNIRIVHRKSIIKLTHFSTTLLDNNLVPFPNNLNINFILFLRFLIVDNIGKQIQILEHLPLVLLLYMHLKDILLVIVSSFGRLLHFPQILLKCQRKEIRLKIELEHILLNIKLTSVDLDIGHPDVYLHVRLVLL